MPMRPPTQAAPGADNASEASSADQSDAQGMSVATSQVLGSQAAGEEVSSSKHA
jgi:hypothetical protein